MLKNRNGFTYLDIVVSFAIFGLFLVILIHVGNTVYRVTRVSELNNRMIHIADLELENYKSKTSDISNFINDTGFSLLSELKDQEGNLSIRILENNNVDGEFSVRIIEEVLRENISEVTVNVISEKIDVDQVEIISNVLWDSDGP